MRETIPLPNFAEAGPNTRAAWLLDDQFPHHAALLAYEVTIPVHQQISHLHQGKALIHAVIGNNLAKERQILQHNLQRQIISKITAEHRYEAFEEAIIYDRKVCIGSLFIHELRLPGDQQLSSEKLGKLLVKAAQEWRTVILKGFLAHDLNPQVAANISADDLGKALVSAARGGDKDSVAVLLAHDLNPQVAANISVDDRGEALVSAAREGDKDSVAALLAHDLKPAVGGQMLPKHRLQALGNALANGHMEIAALLFAHEVKKEINRKIPAKDRAGIVEPFVRNNKKAAVEAFFANELTLPKNRNRQIPGDRLADILFRAVSEKSSEIMPLIFAHDLNPRVKEKMWLITKGGSFIQAVEAGYIEGIDAHLAHDANPLVIGKIPVANRAKAMHHAAKNGRLDIVQKLLAHELLPGITPLSSDDLGVALYEARTPAIVDALLTHDLNPAVIHKITAAKRGSILEIHGKAGRSHIIPLLNHDANPSVTEKIPAANRVEVLKNTEDRNVLRCFLAHELKPGISPLSTTDMDKVLWDVTSVPCLIDLLNHDLKPAVTHKLSATKRGNVLAADARLCEIDHLTVMLQHDNKPSVNEKIPANSHGNALINTIDTNNDKSFECVKLLLANQAHTVNKISAKFFGSALDKAVRKNRRDIVQTILAHQLTLPVDQQISSGDSGILLGNAIVEKRFDIAEALIDHNAHSTILEKIPANDRGMALEHLAKNRRLDLMQKLLAQDRDASKKIPAKNRMNTLGYAIGNDHHEMTMVMLAHEKNPNVKEKLSPAERVGLLEIAARKKNLVTIDKLLRHELTLPQEQRISAQGIVSAIGHTPNGEDLRTVLAFFKHDLRKFVGDDKSPADKALQLYIAAAEGNATEVKTLLDNESKPDNGQPIVADHRAMAMNIAVLNSPTLDVFLDYEFMLPNDKKLSNVSLGQTLGYAAAHGQVASMQALFTYNEMLQQPVRQQPAQRLQQQPAQRLSVDDQAIALKKAAIFGQADAVTLLLARNTITLERRGDTLMNAALHGQVASINALLAYENTQAALPGRTALANGSWRNYKRLAFERAAEHGMDEAAIALLPHVSREGIVGAASKTKALKIILNAVDPTALYESSFANIIQHVRTVLPERNQPGFIAAATQQLQELTHKERYNGMSSVHRTWHKAINASTLLENPIETMLVTEEFSTRLYALEKEKAKASTQHQKRERDGGDDVDESWQQRTKRLRGEEVKARQAPHASSQPMQIDR